MKLLPVALLSASLVGCAVQQPKVSSGMLAAAPRSILVVPVVNHSLDVDAPTYLLASLAVPLAEKGYYVFPVNTTKVVLEQEGFYEGEVIQNQPPADIAKLFGADAVLYVTINRWDAQYAILATTVTVDFDYRIVTKQGDEVWKTKQHMQYSPQASNAGNPLATLIAAAVTAAMTRAAPNYMPLARQANINAFAKGLEPIPDGPYLVKR